jgi:hypothetical protein
MTKPKLALAAFSCSPHASQAKGWPLLLKFARTNEMRDLHAGHLPFADLVCAIVIQPRLQDAWMSAKGSLPERQEFFGGRAE